MYYRTTECSKHSFMQKIKVELNIDLQSCGGSTRIVARNSWIAGGGGEAVGRQ